MSVRFLFISRNFISSFTVCAIFLICFPAFISSAIVTLKSIEIYKTHEWLKSKPTIYFLCQGENKTILPDIKDAHVPYSFKGEESWQPLTDFRKKKCKRCGFYEADSIKADDVFDEWELCPFDFKAPHWIYNRVNAKEFNATFLCPDCRTFENGPIQALEPGSGNKGMHVLIAITVSAVALIMSIIAVLAGCKYWQKRKRVQDQARFLKLFEDGDDIEDQFGLGNEI